MSSKFLNVFSIFLAVALIGGLGFFLFQFNDREIGDSLYGETVLTAEKAKKGSPREGSRRQGGTWSAEGDVETLRTEFDFAKRATTALLRQIVDAQGGAYRDEAILRFHSEDAYRRFLADARANGVSVISSDDDMRAVRLRFDSPNGLADEFARLNEEDVSAEPNGIVSIPPPPPGGLFASVQDGARPFGLEFLEWMGVTGDNSQWGTGVTVAVIDSGINAHPTFREGQIRFLDLDTGFEIGGDFDHATPVAALIAGNEESALGVAPGASLLSIGVLDSDGFASSFDLARAIYLAVDNGAAIINVSLGSPLNSSILQEAVDYATSRGSIIVAATGNDGGSVLFPAAFSNSLAIGAVEASGTRVAFSSFGDEVDLAAPGFGIVSAYGANGLAELSGTSFAVPLTSGALAYVVQTQGVSGVQAGEILKQYANAAGAPGFDVEHGAGNVSLERIVNAGNRGYTNLAVASHSVDGNRLTVTVENRGNQPVFNSQLSVRAGNVDRYPVIGIDLLDVGGEFSQSFSLPASAFQENGQVAVRSVLTGGLGAEYDANLKDNVLSNAIAPLKPLLGAE